MASRSGVLYLDNFFRMGASAVTSFALARLLGPESFGMLNYSTALTAIFFALASFGLENPTILRLVRGGNPASVLGTAMAIRLVTSSVCLIAGCGIVWLLEGAFNTVFWLNVAQLACMSFYVLSSAEFWFKSRTEPLIPAAMRSSAVAVSSLGKIGMAVASVPLVWFGIPVLLEAAIMSLGVYWAYRWKAPRDERALTFDRGQVPGMLKDAYPFVIAAFSVLIYMKIDAVMLGKMAGHHENGIYGVSQKLTEILYIVPVVLTDTIYPTLIGKRTQGKKEFARLFQLFVDGAVVISLVAIVCSILLARPAIMLVFGEEYAASVDIFHINAWACLLVTLSYVRARWLAIEGLQKYESWATAIGAVTNILLNLVMIPRWGAIGAAWASLLSYAVAGVLTSFLLPGTRAVGMHQIRALWPFGRLAAAVRTHYLSKVTP
nr:flippase [Paludibacterium paludis]